MQVIISTWSSFSEKWCLSHIHVNILNFQNLTPDITRLRFLNLIINLCKFNLNLIITSVTLLISNFNLCVPLSPFTRELFYIPEKKPFVYEKKTEYSLHLTVQIFRFSNLCASLFPENYFLYRKKESIYLLKK